MEKASLKRQKIELWINPADKRAFKNACKSNGYTVAEVLRRMIEEKTKELKNGKA